MNEELLSALLDGECSRSELDDILRRLEREPALRAQLARLSLARDVRRGLRVKPANGDLAARVRAALAAEAETPARRHAIRRRLPWRPAAALAAAAAFAALALFVIKPQPASVASTVSAAAVQPVALDARDLRDLRRYQISYSETRAHAVGGTLGYARYAAYVDDPAVATGR